MRKRVGIITINGVYNYGNCLQNYAMLKVLEQCGCDAFTIERESSDAKKKAKRILSYGSLKLILSAMMLIRPKNRYIYKRELKFLHFEKSLQIKRVRKDKLSQIAKTFDFFIAGSDQVWNFDFGFNDMAVNMLSFCEPGQRIAYAASIGMNALTPAQQAVTQKYLTSFKAISVRENDAKDMIASLIDNPVEVVLDPVFLADDSVWKRVMRMPEWFVDQKYILVYFLGEKTEAFKNLIELFRQKYGYKIIDVLDPYIPSYNVGPREFVWLIKNASCVITDSFHATVFSMIYERPLSIMPKAGRRAAMSGRFETLRSNLGLEGVFDNYDPESVLSMDYSEIKRKIATEREKSLAFLKRALETE